MNDFRNYVSEFNNYIKNGFAIIEKNYSLILSDKYYGDVLNSFQSDKGFIEYYNILVEEFNWFLHMFNFDDPANLKNGFIPAMSKVADDYKNFADNLNLDADASIENLKKASKLNGLDFGDLSSKFKKINGDVSALKIPTVSLNDITKFDKSTVDKYKHSYTPKIPSDKV